MREQVKGIVESHWFQNFIIIVILLNAVTLAAETSDGVMAAIGPVLIALDKAALVIFSIEILLKLFALRTAFFKDGWNVFDFIIVAIALVPAAGPLSVLRALRVLRILRLISMMASLRRVVEGAIRALPGMGSIVLVLGLVYFVFSVMATKLFGNSFPDEFGTMGNSLFTLFAIMTLEGWAEIAGNVMKVYPQAWAFFIPFIVLSAFMVLNLFIGVIVNAMQESTEAGAAEDAKKSSDRIADELSALRSEVAALRETLKR